MKAEDLTEKQMEEFAEEFYMLCPFNDLVEGNPYPWGLPWTWEPKIELEGETVVEMARNFYETRRPEFERMSDIWKEMELGI